ncbi:hypothetical protein B0J13DRAFT_185711 [Dactylonectria estremocensis]|uniref:Uncharacterized protein n=1 Tax=Dactylonectria estremocensis TaxID=1079267 RepID=A0A9P9FC38_9HYPO|nr:hypothetical protein B0J13DRAFT_185711 [Dactylonectria estremocensis]
MDGPSKNAFQFVQLSHPQDVASWKRQVRSHAAKNSRVRQQKVIQYQQEKVKETQALHAKEALGQSEHLQRAGALVTGSVTTAIGAARTDPFDTFARKVSKFESFLLDHFVNQVVLHVVTCYPMNSAADEAEFRLGMATHWVRLASTDIGMLATLFLASCRNLANYQHAEFYTTTSLRYKGQCIATLKSDLAQENSMVSDATITKTLVLASEALLAGDHAATKQHSQAAKKMVAMRGGIETLGMNGFMKKLIIWFVREPEKKGTSLLLPTCVVSVSNAEDG